MASVLNKTTKAGLALLLGAAVLLQGQAAYAQTTRPAAATVAKLESAPAADDDAQDQAAVTPADPEAPTETEPPTATEAPATTEPPAATETPEPTEPPTTTAPPVETAQPEPTTDAQQKAPAATVRPPAPEGSNGALTKGATTPQTKSRKLFSGAAAAGRSLTVGFKSNYIISDSKMYDGRSMSATAIQKFLNQQVPRCTIGDPGRKPGSAWGSTKIANGCLRNATFKTTTHRANAYCKAYTGSSKETAAQIIAKVGVACGISPKVLLVRLQLEQTLIADTWPTVSQLDKAMGYACPDSGPNNSANCNSQYFGFANQVYWAAWQYRDYKARPSAFNHAGGKKSYVAWTTNDINRKPVNCGGTFITMKNNATAALYNYTPYQPNPAALNAGWGTGDKCSSYGNRNFYMIYHDWFEAPNSVFTDVTQGHKYFTQIEWVGTKALTTGVRTSKGLTYQPTQNIDRATTAAMIYRWAGSPKVKLPKKSPYADVKATDANYTAIVWAYQKGLSKGYKKGTKRVYNPTSTTTRQAMARFLFKAAPGTAKYRGPTNTRFADIKKGSSFYNEVSWMYKAGITKGYAQKKGKPLYQPTKKVTRQMMAAYLYRMKR